MGGVVTGEGHEGTCWNVGNILYFDLGNVYTDVYVCKNSSSCTLNFVHLTLCKKKRNTHILKSTKRKYVGNICIIVSDNKGLLKHDPKEKNYKGKNKLNFINQKI